MSDDWTLGEARRESLALVESVRDYAIFLLDAQGRIRSWNAGAHLIKQYDRDEILGQHISRFYTDEDRAARRAEYLLGIAARDGRVEDEGWRVRKDGSRFWADVVITAIRDDHGTVVGFLKVTRDLTVRRAAEEALRRSEESLSATLYSIGDGVIATDERGHVTRLNPVAEALTGWTQVDALGQPIQAVFNIVNELTRAPAVNPVNRVLAEGVVVGLANHTALIARDGTERPIADSGSPIRDASGRILGVVMVFRDVSEERRADQEQLRAQRAEEAVRERDVFLSVAAHELRTPLTALQLKLQGLEQLVQKYMTPEGIAKVAPRFQDALRQTTRLGELVERLLDVSRIAAVRLVLELEDADLASSVESVVRDVKESATQAHTEIRVSVTGDAHGRWDRRRIEQVVLNLLSNALRYGNGQPIDITVVGQADTVVLTVVDRGIGIAEGDLNRIFSPFERAAPVEHFSGLGLGLYITKGIVEAHGGTIVVASEPQRGSTFTVRLPRQRGAP